MHVTGSTERIQVVHFQVPVILSIVKGGNIEQRNLLRSAGFLLPR
jgi:hypothetical protein